MHVIAPLDRSSRVYVAGHRGMVGSAIWRRLQSAGFVNLIGASSRELDLRDQHSTEAFIRRTRPDVIIDAAARVGGILANDTYPAEFLSDNLRIQLNLMDAANAIDVDRFLFLGSSCIYPKLAPQPISEDALLTGVLEPTNDAYATAKIAGIMHVRAARRQFGRHWISAMPTNLYGPGDNFSLTRSHVLPALLRKFHEAKLRGTGEVVVWGSGLPRREFLHVDDLADAVLFLLENYDDDQHVNIGVGRDLSIHELAVMVSEVVGFDGAISMDATKPDGTPQKLLDISRLAALGWRASTSLRAGISSTYEWFVEHQSDARV